MVIINGEWSHDEVEATGDRNKHNDCMFHNSHKNDMMTIYISDMTEPGVIIIQYIDHSAKT